MSDIQLKDKAIDIKGKQYVQVKDRVSYFNTEYPNGHITTEIISDTNGVVVIRATATPDFGNPSRIFTGISASNPSKTIEKMSPYEVAETSAVGRALAFMGIGVIDSIGSADEMVKAGVVKTEDHDSADTAVCRVHKVKMNHYENAQGEWWSHKLEDGNYCNGRDTKYNGGGK
jgi:hypothetical protein